MRLHLLFMNSVIVLSTLIFQLNVLSQTWQWICPSVTGNNLNGIYLRDTVQAWIVGDLGTMLSTKDGGHKFILDVDTINFLNQTAIAQQYASVLWKASSGPSRQMPVSVSNIMKSDDGGQTWTQKFSIESTPPAKAIHSIQFANDSSGYACGDSGLYVETTDGGEQWDVHQSGLTLFDLHRVQFVSDSIGFMGGGIIHAATLDPPWDSSYSYGAVYKTTDKGTTWDTSFSDSMIVNDIHFVSSQIGYGTATKLFDNTGRREYLLRTRNSGLSWDKIEFPGFPFEPSPLSVYFNDEFNGFVCGYYGLILRTSNGGESWISPYVPPVGSASFNKISFIDQQHGTCVGSDGVVVVTTDGGATWNQRSGLKFISSMVNRVCFLNKDTGWIVSYGVSYKTTDAGQSWGQDVLSNIKAYDFVNQQVGWCAGDSGNIYKTSNAGQTWELQSSGTSEDLIDVNFASENIGWVIGSSFVLKSNDGGRVWGTQDVAWDVYPALARIIVQDSSHVWLWGWGESARTTDGGLTWITSQKDTAWIDAPLGSKGSNTFIFGNIGWRHTLGAIFKSTDGGLTWHTHQIFSYETVFNDMFFLDAFHGWIVGNVGTVLRYGYDINTRVEFKDLGQVPHGINLKQNYPNPFNSITFIQFVQTSAELVTVKIFDLSGRIVKTLVNQLKYPGEYTIIWDGSNDNGYQVGTGFYLCVLKSGPYAHCRKLLFVK